MALVPPTTELGFMDTLCITADAAMPKPQLTVLFPYCAETESISEVNTPEAVIVNVAEFAPAAIRTDDGT